MSKSQLKTTSTRFLITALLFSGVMLLIANEFLTSSRLVWLRYMSLSFLIIGFYDLIQHSFASIQKYKKLTLLFFLGTTVFVLLHFGLNSINLYQQFQLPPLFFQIKLHRLISLSPFFVLTLWSLTATSFLINQTVTFVQKQPKALRYLILYLAIVLITQTTNVLAHIYQQSTYILLNLKTPFDARIEYVLGGSTYYGWIWPYTQFIKRHTPESAVIFIPPQSVVWKMEGNEAYLRWYLYPRKLLPSTIDQPEIPEKAEYVLISLGECGEGDCGWPKVEIPQEEIDDLILIDRQTQVETILENQDYELDLNKYQWGVIKLRK